MIEEMLAYNREFVRSRGYEKFQTSKFPDKKIAILTCMDTRLVELLPAALGIRNGDVKLIKNAGGMITGPFDSAVRSLLVGIIELGVEEVMVIGHTDCGVAHINADMMIRHLIQRGISQDHIDMMRYCGIDFEAWLRGFDCVENSVAETVDLLQKDKKWIRRHINGKRIAMVFQDPMTSLDPTMTIGKQIMEGMLWHFKMPKTEAYKKALELLEEVGITDAEKRMKNYPHQLSGGMRQRVVIAIALSCDPDLLICDEPTTALDVTIQAKILELIRRIQKERGISVIYITHDLGVVAKVADYVDVMYAGKIVETGTIGEIFYDPKHPYTWGLLSAMPDLDTADDRLYTIPGSPPNLLHEKPGDAFAPRNRFALNIDDEIDPPMFKISDTHYAATWLLDPRAPKVEMPPELKERIARMKAEAKKIEEAE